MKKTWMDFQEEEIDLYKAAQDAIHEIRKAFIEGIEELKNEAETNEETEVQATLPKNSRSTPEKLRIEADARRVQNLKK